MKHLSIGEVARRTGIRTSALRYYEEAGILPTPARVSGRRQYDAAVMRQINVLRFAQQAGFTLREIKILFHGFGPDTTLSARWKSLAKAKLRELDDLAPADFTGVFRQFRNREQRQSGRLREEVRRLLDPGRKPRTL